MGQILFASQSPTSLVLNALPESARSSVTTPSARERFTTILMASASSLRLKAVSNIMAAESTVARGFAMSLDRKSVGRERVEVAGAAVGGQETTGRADPRCSAARR